MFEHGLPVHFWASVGAVSLLCRRPPPPLLRLYVYGGGAPLDGIDLHPPLLLALMETSEHGGIPA
jgi:hypothetical protein